MYEVLLETVQNAHKPFDIIRLPSGEIAYINITNINSCQSSPQHQVSYSITFLTENKNQEYFAWYHNGDFDVIGNIFVKMAEDNSSCRNRGWVKKVMEGKL